MDDAIFDSWSGVERILVVGPLGYVALVLILRVSGKRTLSKFNAFDFVVTVALGSTLATVLTSKSLPLVEGVLALATLIVMQFAITWVAVRSSWFSDVIKGEPTLIAHKGRLLEAALRRQRVTPEEALAAVRGSGIEGLEGVDAVVLETDGSISVIKGRS
jgi:uncharacterized membrane protein YcaP (DUF421 family)